MSVALEFDRVSKWYGVVLGISDITFRIDGGVVGLVGKNGAGKTTLMKLASGLLQPSLGRVRVYGESPARSIQVRKRIGLCPDVDHFYEGMTGLRWVTLMAKLSGVAGAKACSAAVLERLGMAEHMNKRIGGYSKGMRQRTKLARSLVQQATLLLLDEPLNGLDPVGRREMIELIQELGAEGRAVLVSSHVLAEVQDMTDQVIMIHQGRMLAEGNRADIRDQLADRAYMVELRAHDLRGLAARIVANPGVEGVEVAESGLIVRVRDAQGFFSDVTRVGTEARFGLEAVIPLDAGLDAVFDYLVAK